MNRRPKAFCSNIHTYSALLCLVVIFAVVLADVVYVVASEAVLVAIDMGVVSASSLSVVAAVGICRCGAGDRGLRACSNPSTHCCIVL